MADIHANALALDAVLDVLGSCDELWVLGDIVGYGPEPESVVDRLRSLSAICVQGNHDHAVATGRVPLWFRDAARHSVELHQTWLNADALRYLRELPRVLVRHDHTLYHGSAIDPLTEYVFTPEAAATALRATHTTHACNGHTHIPAVFDMASDGSVGHAVYPRAGQPVALVGRSLANPGSVGQPRDGDPRAAFAVLDLLAQTFTVGRVAYDVERAQTLSRARGLPGTLADRLATGS